MDKETLSNYGWIVICVLVLAVMIALATPFGNFVADAVKSTTKGLFATNQSALNGTSLMYVEDNFYKEELNHENTIPSNGVYYKGVANKSIGDYTGYTHIFVSKDSFPELETGDIYVYGDYEYRYNNYFTQDGWETDESQMGWGVRAKKDNKEEYGEILVSINNGTVNTLRSTFSYCARMICAPNIRSNITNMDHTFSYCQTLKEFKTIDITGITKLDNTFYGCNSLVDASRIKITPNIKNINGAFMYCHALKVSPDFSNAINLQKMNSTFYSSGLEILPDLSNCQSLTDINETFALCTNLVDAKNFYIPENVISMYGTFSRCTNLKIAPYIPKNVRNLTITFIHCESLTGIITIDAIEVNPYRTFENTTQSIFLTGNCPRLNDLAETDFYDDLSENDNVRVLEK